MIKSGYSRKLTKTTTPTLVSVLAVTRVPGGDKKDILSQRMSVMNSKMASVRGVEDTNLTVGMSSDEWGK
jgi:hypothetical protein